MADSGDGDLRMLGAGDGLVHALVAIKVKLGHLTYDPINPRHLRKIKRRDDICAPLRELQVRLTDDFNRSRNAWEGTRGATIEEGKG